VTRLPTERCPAKAKSTGQQCKHRVTAGGVCDQHGGRAPQVQRKRLERIALAQALAADPRRDPAEVLADVLHQSDWLMRRAREEVRSARPTAATMKQLLELTDQAGRWAKTALDADTSERQTRVAEVQAVALAGVIRRVLDRLSLTPEQLALVPVVVPAEIERLAIEGGSQ
jgi:hypothetical protein